MTSWTIVTIASDNILKGKLVLCKCGSPVWIADIGDPIEDVEFDTIYMNSADYDRVKALESE